METKESSGNESCLASVEGIIERTLEFQVVIEHTTSVKPVGCSNQWARRTPGGFALCVNENPTKRLRSPRVPVVHWLKHPIGVKEVVHSSFIWNSKIFSVVLYPLPSNHHLHHMSTGAFKNHANQEIWFKFATHGFIFRSYFIIFIILLHYATLQQIYIYWLKLRFMQ